MLDNNKRSSTVLTMRISQVVTGKDLKSLNLDQELLTNRKTVKFLHFTVQDLYSRVTFNMRAKRLLNLLMGSTPRKVAIKNSEYLFNTNHHQSRSKDPLLRQFILEGTVKHKAEWLFKAWIMLRDLKRKILTLSHKNHKNQVVQTGKIDLLKKLKERVN